MTDPFEDAVRQAARGLGTTGVSHETPTYHDAWNRGRRRRFVKQAGIASVGVLLFVAAFSVDLGSFRGTTSETDDVALAVEAATAVPAPVATTEPLPVPSATPPAAAAASEPEPAQAATAPPGAVSPSPVPPDAGAPATQPTADTAAATDAGTQEPSASQAEPATPPAAAAAAPPTTVPAESPAQDTAESSTASTVPTVEPTLDLVPAETALSPTIDPAPTAVTADQGRETPTPEAADIADPGVVIADSLVDGLVAEPSSSLAAADASALVAPTEDGTTACDMGSDGTVDATCELKPAYACDPQTQPLPGYKAFDLDGDGVTETCAAPDVSSCDTTGDGLGDTPCIIDALPQPSADN